MLVAEDAEGISDEAFDAYATRLYQYLQASQRLPAAPAPVLQSGNSNCESLVVHCRPLPLHDSC